MASPDFVCLGFQKSGTSTLYEILNRHPDVALCRDVKEPMYYRVGFFHVIGGRRFYEKRYFGHIPDEDTRRIGEVNAGLTFNNCAKRIAKNFDPDTKLIFMLRDPVARSYSAYKYFLPRGFLPPYVIKNDQLYGHAKAFDMYVHDVLDHEKTRAKIMDQRMNYLIFSQSNYAQCIEEYLAYFPREQMMFLFFEDFIRDQHKTCQKLYDFLGIPDCDDIPYGMHINGTPERTKSAFHAKTLMLLKAINYFLLEFAATPYWIPPFYKWYHGRYEAFRAAAMLPDADKGRILPETESLLRSYYAAEVDRASEIVGRDLRALWWTAKEDSEEFIPVSGTAGTPQKSRKKRKPQPLRS